MSRLARMYGQNIPIYQYLLLPSETISLYFFNIFSRTIVFWLSSTRGIAPSSLNPGLLTFNPCGVGFDGDQHCGLEIQDCATANFNIFTFSSFHII